MKKLKTIACSLACLGVVAVSSIQSYSYLQSYDDTTNKYTVGHSDCEIVESLTKPSTYGRGTKIKDSVSVQNTGSVPCYVRVHIVPKYSNSFTFNTSSSWVKDGDWYYYDSVVAPGKTTSPVYTTVTLGVDMSSWSSNDMQIFKYAECIQSEGYSSSKEAFK